MQRQLWISGIVGWVTLIDLATGITFAENDSKVCENCIKGKLSQSKFPTSERRAKKPLWLIHSDLCGPMQTATPSGNKYLLTFIDDYSRFTVLRLIKSSSRSSKRIHRFNVNEIW